MSDQSKCISFHPESWEDLCVFRETYLYPLLSEEVGIALRLVGQWLYYLTLSQDGLLPTKAESPIHCELRGAARDLRHVEAFLSAVYGQVEGSSLETADTRLALPAQDLSDRISQIANEIEGLIGPDPEQSTASEANNGG